MDIFVGSLSFKLKESELREAFEKFGEVSSAKIIIDKITRQSKGFGFVEMPDETQARTAISELNGTEMYGRPLVVNESKGKESTPRSSDSGRSRDDAPRTFNKDRSSGGGGYSGGGSSGGGYGGQGGGNSGFGGGNSGYGGRGKSDQNRGDRFSGRDSGRGGDYKRGGGGSSKRGEDRDEW
ncbi:MAG TPA: RNA-binding protein [Dyadobacter sp.]|nr:RNA-binding protein [Dyadobacter sp.]